MTTSLCGFLDLSAVFYSQTIPWTLVSLWLFVGTIVSNSPQIYKIIKRRSSEGLSTLSVASQMLYRFSVVLNIVCLQSTDFIALIQFDQPVAIHRLMTFIINLEVWLIWLPVGFLMDVFPGVKTRFNWDRLSNFLLPVIFLIYFSIFLVIGGFYGFESSPVKDCAYLLGAQNDLLVIFQYLPQIYTTFKNKQSGSLSILTLALQAPGSFLDASFLAFGQTADWSTYCPIALTGVFQTILTIMAIYYDRKKAKNLGFSVIPEETHENGMMSSQSQSGQSSDGVIEPSQIL